MSVQARALTCANDGREPKQALRRGAQGLIFKMQTEGEHVKAVYEIVQQTVSVEKQPSFPRFHAVIEQVVGESKPPADTLPWLLLPVFTCEAVGGDVHHAHYVAAALEMGRIAAGCLDEWQDGDTDGALWRSLGPARAVNVSTALIPLSLLTLSRLAGLGVGASAVLALHDEFHRTLVEMCAGQDADLDTELVLEDVERVAAAKSGALFRIGCRAGALIAGASSEVVERFGEFGANLGIVAQLWNDLEGLEGVRGKRDVEQGRGLPAVVARSASNEVDFPMAETERAAMLYALVRIKVYHRRAAKALARCPAAGRLPRFLDVYSPGRMIEQVQ